MTEEKHICPKCGTPMEPQNLNGSFCLDGTSDMSGYYCPNCDKQPEDSEDAND